ncbi:MAG: YggT family protein [Solirubrobacterales bacterium]|jgi:YggT family protein|nr:YggT family protein [Solirubrobacterales bacterium]
MIPLGLSRANVADYVNALFLVYTIMILCNVLLSYIPRIPYNPALRAVLDFITDTTNPFLNIFRRITRPIGVGGMGFDISPILALIVLGILNAIIVRGIIG